MKVFIISIISLILCFFLICHSQGRAPDDWMDRAIARDFKRYEKGGISKALLEETWRVCKKHKEFYRYQIIHSQVYGPESRIKILLEEIIRHYPVPDVDFIYFYEDRLKKTFFKRSKHKTSAPLFASAKEKSIDQVILFADWNYDIRDENSGWNALIRKVNEAYSKINWTQKTEKVFWRGLPWDGKHFGMYSFENWKSLPRGFLVAQSRQYPEWINAAFSEYPPRCAQESLSRCIQEMGEIQFIPWEEVFCYKYHAIVDGVTCSFPATQWKLLSGSLCFKQDSDDIQYYYGELIPWKHYIPIKRDLSDLLTKLCWAKAHDQKAREIAQNSRIFAQTHLMPEHILLYCYKVLCKYASLQHFQPEISTENPL